MVRERGERHFGDAEPAPRSWVRDYHQRRRPLDHGPHALAGVSGIERGEALVEHHQLGALQQRARDEQAAALAVRELPAASRRPSASSPAGMRVEQLAEPELAADALGLVEVARRAAATRGP